MKLIRNLCPDIECKSSQKIYTYDKVNDVWPIVQILKSLNYSGKILISGEGSMGKTTTLKELRLHLLEEYCPYTFFNLKELNHINFNIIDINEYVKSKVDTLFKAEVVILDAFDETATVASEKNKKSVREVAEKIIEAVNKLNPQLFIVVARTGTLTTKVEFNTRVTIDCTSWLGEMGFTVYELKKFSVAQIRELIGDDYSESMQALLQNTMCLFLYIQIKMHGCTDIVISNEGQLIDVYFKTMIKDKIDIDPTYKNVVIDSVFDLIVQLGENIYARFYGLNCNKVELKEQAILNTIFTQIKEAENCYAVEATQEKYLSYCLAKYLYSQLLNEDIINLIGRVVVDTARIRIFQDGVYMLGQLLQNDSALRNRLSILIGEIGKRYLNLVYLYLGLNDGKINESIYKSFSGFRFGLSWRRYLRNIILSNKEVIEDLQFSYCRALENVIIPDTVMAIGESAFLECSSLKEIAIPSAVKSIGKGAFSGCSSLRKVTIPGGLNKVGQSVFLGCKNLKTIVFYGDKDVSWAEVDGFTVLKKTTIKKRNLAICTFKESTESKYYTLNNFEGVGQWIFNNCLVPKQDPLKLIWWEVFKECYPIQKIVVDSIADIPEYAFYGCNKLKEVFLNGRNLRHNVFTECTSLEVVKLSGIDEIGVESFGWCSAIKEITIPGSVKVICERAFFSCSSLATVYLENGIEEICEEAFGFCTSLESIVIPISLKNIGDRAFIDCEELKKVIIYGTPNISKNAFEGCSKDLQIIYYNT